jgi:hypothetical protein
MTTMTAAGAALALTVVLAAAHSYLGERYILIRLFRREDLPRIFGDATFTKRTLRFAWHLTSVAYLGLGAVLLVLARQPSANGAAAQIIAATFAASALVSLVGSRGRHLSWIVFGLLAVLAWRVAP